MTIAATPHIAPAREFTPAEFVAHCFESVRTSMEPKLSDLRKRCAEAAAKAAHLAERAVKEAVNNVLLEVP